MSDTLSDVFFSFDASPPWVTEAPDAKEIAPRLLPEAEHVIPYHVVTASGCWGGIVGEEPVWLEAGDVLILPQGDPHVLSSTAGMRGYANPDAYAIARDAPAPVPFVMDGGGPETATVVCGFLGCDARPFNPLLATLPRVIHLRGADDPSHRTLVELAIAESKAPRTGSDGVLSRLSELLFVVAVRHYVASLPTETAGWFAGLRDPNVGRALQKLHERPEHAWTLEELAKESGVSRSLLAERFAHLVGVPPIQYLTQWRIQLAASLLRSTSESLAEIADRVGYGSEAALSRAFKRCAGVAPAHYRRESPR